MLRLLGRRGSRTLNRWFILPDNPLTLWERPIKVFWQLGIIGFKAGLWLTIFAYITGLFPQLRIWRYTLYALLTVESIPLGDREYSPLRLLLLVGLTVGLWFIARLVAKLFRIYILTKARVESRLQDILSALIQYSLLFLGIILLLQAFGINASSLAILASLLGVGIGFGVQNITNNFISGFIITLERPIQVGDFIKLDDLVGIVKRVGARSTEITTLDRVSIIVPNSRFLESEIINWSHGNPVSRLRVPVGVAYGADITLVKTALLEAVKRHPEVLLKPDPEIWFQNFGDSSLNFEVMVWTGDPRKQFRVKSDLNYAIEASLRHHGIEIPFPQRDLHLRSPQLDDILSILKRRSAADPPLPEPLPTTPIGHSAEDPVEQTTEQTSPLPDLLADLDVEALAEAMQGGQGVALQGHADTSPSYFTGTAAVVWLQKKRHYTHKEALLVGQWLLRKGLIYAIEDSLDFEDSQALYQFYQDSPAALAKSVESPENSVISDGDATEIYSPEAD
ncbi:MAG: mechanosensitive ion channel [Symploca sp. SIO2G7]|nr:mechanosensitive ion channel [Symploca sp. SIO2G7]